MIKDLICLLSFFAALYIAANGVIMTVGLFDNIECKVFRNYEYIFPGKQVGCWLAKPVEELENE